MPVFLSQLVLKPLVDLGRYEFNLISMCHAVSVLLLEVEHGFFEAPVLLYKVVYVFFVAFLRHCVRDFGLPPCIILYLLAHSLDYDVLEPLIR